jgi:hypothetical protein
MRMWRALFIALALFVALFGAFYFLGTHSGDERSGVLNTTAWQRMALPGELSQAHAFLEHNCAACHTAVEGVEASSCKFFATPTTNPFCNGNRRRSMPASVAAKSAT